MVLKPIYQLFIRLFECILYITLETRTVKFIHEKKGLHYTVAYLKN